MFDPLGWFANQEDRYAPIIWFYAGWVNVFTWYAAMSIVQSFVIYFFEAYGIN